MKALPQAIATPNIHIGIMRRKVERRDPGADAQRLAHRIDVDAGPRARCVYSPFRTCGMPQANSITSSPRWMSPLLSAITLPCSDDSRWASASMFASTSRLECEHHPRPPLRVGRRPARLRALRRRHRAVEVGDRPSVTCACTCPVFGSNTSPRREPPLAAPPAKTCPIVRISVSITVAWRSTSALGRDRHAV